MNLKEWRNAIDTIDRELINLFGKRLQIAKEIAQLKKKENLPVLNKEREKAVLEQVRTLAQEKKLAPPIMEKIFTHFIEYCRLEEEKEMGHHE